jgi:hypothetical protein
MEAKAEIRDISESICFICLDNTSDDNTTYIKKFMSIPCSCRWASHVNCYEEWIKTTDMICPYCRLYDDYTFENNDADDDNNVIMEPPRLRRQQLLHEIQIQGQHQHQPQHQPQHQHMFINQAGNGNRYQIFFILRCIDVVGNGIIIFMVYFILIYYFTTLSKKILIDYYSPLEPMVFH